jgi:hypothetical protein
MVQDSHRNFTERAMQQYVNKHKRKDRDPDQIAFEKQKQHCTFAPATLHSKPGPVGKEKRGADQDTALQEFLQHDSLPIPNESTPHS